MRYTKRPKPNKSLPLRKRILESGLFWMVVVLSAIGLMLYVLLPLLR